MEQNYIVEIIDSLAEKFGIVVDWTNQNVMPYIEDLMQRIVSYEITSNIFTMALWAFLAIVTGITISILHKKQMASDYPYDEDEPLFVQTIIGWVAFAICAIGTIVSIGACGFRIIECVNIPEKIFIELIGAYI
jgi:hypothetical protein